MMQLLAWFAKGVAFLVQALPYRMQKFLGHLLGHLWFDVLRIRRDVIFKNLNIAFPEWSEEKKTKVGRASCHNLGMTLVEFCRIPFVNEKTKDDFIIEGLDRLETAKAKGKGVILLTLHLGDIDWAATGLAIYGQPLTIISKEFSIRWLNDLWFGVRRNLGSKFIAPRNSSITILRALKAGETVVFVLDQFMGPPIGIKTRFFGVETGTAMGLAILAGRAGAPVVPAYTYRLKDGKTYVGLDHEIPFVESANKGDTIRDMTQVYTDQLEKYVRLCPEQWMWVHRRWKKFVVSV
jgi:KDO2-lipid IV(A) lauroyltransferase